MMESVSKILSHLDVYLSLGRGRLETVKALILGIISARTVNLKEVCSRFEHGIESSNYRKVQYFFQKQTLDDAEVIRFIMNHLFAPHEQVTLAIDRTDWGFGKTRHNLLCISVLYKETAIPLIVLPLERKGNSNYEHRKEIVKTILSVLPARKIKALSILRKSPLLQGGVATKQTGWYFLQEKFPTHTLPPKGQGWHEITPL